VIGSCSPRGDEEQEGAAVESSCARIKYIVATRLCFYFYKSFCGAVGRGGGWGMCLVAWRVRRSA
jgi:hypothetical protein